MTTWINFNPLQREAEDIQEIPLETTKINFNPLQREAEDLNKGGASATSTISIHFSAKLKTGERIAILEKFYFNPLQREAEDEPGNNIINIQFDFNPLQREAEDKSEFRLRMCSFISIHFSAKLKTTGLTTSKGSYDISIHFSAKLKTYPN